MKSLPYSLLRVARGLLCAMSHGHDTLHHTCIDLWSEICDAAGVVQMSCLIHVRLI